MIISLAKTYWQTISYYHRAAPEKKKVILSGFLPTALRQEASPLLRQRLAAMIEREKSK